MGNLASILAHCGRGTEVILGDQCHTFIYEAGGIAALGGIHPRPLPNQPDGTLRLEAIEAAIRPDNVHFPRTRLICLENTHNRCSGDRRDHLGGAGAAGSRYGRRLRYFALLFLTHGYLLTFRYLPGAWI
jgi:threonine aldolase